MMKFLLVIAMFALVGFSSISAAAVDFDDKEIPDSMEDFKETLQRLVRDVSEQIKENADENMDFEKFIQEYKLDDEEASIVTEEEEEFAGDELSAAEDDRSTENVDSGIRCSWHRLAGRCCQSVRVIRFNLSICITAIIMPPTGMRVALSLNGHTIWRRTVASRHSYNVCLKKGSLRLCIKIYNLYVSGHRAQACLRLSGRFHFIRFSKRLGCFSRRYANDEVMPIKETPLQVIENQQMQRKQKNIDGLFLNLKMKKQSDDVIAFHQ